MACGPAPCGGWSSTCRLGHLKSLAASVAMPAWLLGHDPGLAIVNVTYGQNLSEKFARDCRAVMARTGTRSGFRQGSPRRASRCPSSRRQPAVSPRHLRRGRADRPRRRREPDRRPAEAARRPVAEPPCRRQRLFNSTLYSRLHDKQTGAIVFVMPRLHEDDLAGHVLQQGGREVVSFPAVAEDDEEHAIETPRGLWRSQRSAGGVLPRRSDPQAGTRRLRPRSPDTFAKHPAGTQPDTA